MKALGLKTLPYLSALYRGGVISSAERDEYARAIQLAMSKEDFYTAVTCKLRQKVDQTFDKNLCRILNECLNVLSPETI